MSEQLQPQFAPVDHGEWRNVYGRDEVIVYENNLDTLSSTEQAVQLQVAMFEIREDMQQVAADTELSNIIDDYFDKSEDIPELFRNSKSLVEARDDQKVSWSSWLGSHADDEQMLNFLQWHSYQHETRDQSPEFQARIVEQKQEFASRAQALVDAGVLHEESVINTDRLADINITTKDIFSSYFFGEGHTSDPETGHIELIENYTDVILWHEMSHSMLGKLAEDGFDPDQWLNEAVTEHIAQTMMEGDVDIVDPAERNIQGEYPMERKLLSVLLNGGSERISPKYLTRLYSAKTDKAKDKAELDLKDQFEQAYGNPNALNKLSNILRARGLTDSGSYLDSDEAKAFVAEVASDPKRYFGKNISQNSTYAQESGKRQNTQYTGLVDMPLADDLSRRDFADAMRGNPNPDSLVY